MVVLDNELNLLEKYNKNKLVPFGEFLPFENILKKFGLKKFPLDISLLARIKGK